MRAVRSTSKAHNKGAVLVETMIFFSTMMLLFFSLADFAAGIREMNLVTEAARHGARSLAARTKLAGRCPDVIPALYEISCADMDLSSPPADPNTTPFEDTPVWSACSYLKAAGVAYQNFNVTTSYSS